MSRIDFDHFIQNSLNKQQAEAVLQKTGPLLVVAGAGSGKTRVITARIAHLICNEQIAPSSLIALTFTNKAAREMKERIEHFLGSPAELPFIGTFHSYCLSLLKAQSHLLEVPFVSILDADDQQKMLHTILQRNNLQKQISVKQLAYQISYFKNNKANKNDELFTNRLLYDLYQTYEQEKIVSKCLDFDDLLLHALNLFNKNPEFRATFQARIRHVLVDEYQDTNIVQHELLKLITLNEKQIFTVDSLCVVGDEDQSIYSWRGATISNIINFKKDFPTTTIITIEQNYRSVRPILHVANQVIEYNKERNPKELWSEKKGTDRIRGISCLSEYQEGEAVAALVKAINKSANKYTIAILYRTHFQSRAIEEALIKNSLPYTIVGGIQFYERKEIKDLLAYIKLIINPFDRTSFFRIINCPTRGLGPKFEQDCYERWSKEPFLPFQELIGTLIQENMVTGIKKESLQEFLAIFEGLENATLPSVALSQIIKKSKYLTYLDKTYDAQETQTRKENINELIHAIAYFEKNSVNTLGRLLDEIALMQAPQEQDSSQEPVLLMTLHSAKGLEFDCVVLVGLEEGILPSSRSLSDRAALEEERRLLYVGITRAKEYLLFTHARYRYQYGVMSDQRPSQFIPEIPSHLVTWSDASYWGHGQLYDYCAYWLGIAHSKQEPKKEKIEKKTVQCAPSSEENSAWKKHQPVMHPQFGTGLIQGIELKSNQKIYLTVKFKTGTKKIDASFVTSA